MKKCTKCNKTKDYEEFHKDKNTSDGFKIYCKVCRCLDYNNYYKENKEHKREYYKNNKRKIKQYTKFWKEQNRLKVRVYNINYKNKKKCGDKITKTFINNLNRQQCYKCLYCGCDVSEVFHVEHLTALSRGGLNTKDNLAISCPTCNLKKSNKLFFEYFIELCDNKIQGFTGW